jgi:hypothetical protein
MPNVIIFTTNLTRFKDMKKTWSSINQLIRPEGQRNVKIKLKINNDEISEPRLVANKFNEYYTTVTENLKNLIPLTNFDPRNYVESCPNSFVLFPTDSNDIIKNNNVFQF